MEIVTQLGPCDVLFGRGSGPNDHEGNVRFRRLVAERKAEYMATNHRMTKARIAREIVDAVIRENGRFLKKIEAEDARVVGLPDGVDAWTSVDDDTIMEKAKQALRQNTNKSKGPSEPFQNSPAPAVASASIPQPCHTATAFPVPPDLGYVADDLEPIPIPSAEYPGHHDVIPSPTPVREAGQPGINSWPGMGNANAVKQSVPRSSGVNHEQTVQRSSVPVALPSSQHNQKMPLPSLSESSQQNSMQPPAARARSSLRSSNNSTALRLDRGMEKSMEMSDLMDSFSRTHLGAGGQRNMRNSVESMGTIEPMSVGSEANMSYATMNSSVFSILRPEGTDEQGDSKPSKDFPTPDNERSFRELEQEEAPTYVRVYPTDAGAGTGLESDFMSSTKFGLASDASMSIADLGGSRKRQPSSVALKDVKEEGYREVYDSILGEVAPPSMQSDSASGIEAMGSSSLNLLKGMLMSQDELPPSGSSQQQGRSDLPQDSAKK